MNLILTLNVVSWSSTIFQTILWKGNFLSKSLEKNSHSIEQNKACQIFPIACLHLISFGGHSSYQTHLSVANYRNRRMLNISKRCLERIGRPPLGIFGGSSKEIWRNLGGSPWGVFGDHQKVSGEYLGGLQRVSGEYLGGLYGEYLGISKGYRGKYLGSLYGQYVEGL